MTNDAITKTTTSPLLRTKLVPPRPTRGTLPRPRLEQLIERVAESSLTIVKAPPGFGKSTLASAWAEAANIRGACVAWLTLDEADSSPERLLLYVAAAVQQGFEDDDEAELLRDLSLIPLDHLSTLVLNALSRRAEPCFLFIDDYHCVPEAVLIAAFDRLIRFAPNNLHLIFSGRTDLPANLFTHVYSDAYLEVDSWQLRFDINETRDLLLRTGIPGFDASDILDLHAATEGWIAALRASLINHRQHSSTDPRLPKGISDLLNELINRLSPELAAQLPHLAAVDKFNASLVECVVADADGRYLIKELERLQLFISGLDQSGEWFSFHPLFRESLKQRLSPSEIRTSLSKAARWFADNSAWPDAVRCALSAGEDHRAQEWIAYCAMEMVERGDFIILLDWQSQLRDRLLCPPASFRLALAWAAGLAMNCSVAREHLNNVRKELHEGANGELHWECQALEAMILSMEDHPESGGQLAQASLPHLEAHPWIYNTLLNVVCFSHLRRHHWDEFYDVPPVFRPLSDNNRCLFNHVYRLCLVGMGETVQGRLSRAAATYGEGMRVANEKAWGHPVLYALPASFLATVRYQQGDLVEAARLSLESIEIVKLGGSLDFVASAIITASRLSAHNAAGQGPRDYLDEGERLAQSRGWPRLHSELMLERTRLSLLETKHNEAMAWARKLEHSFKNANTDQSSGDAYQSILAALWCEAAGLHLDSDLHAAGAQVIKAEENNCRLMQIQLHAGIALVHWRRDTTDLAVKHLLEACRLVDTCGALQLLADFPARDALQSLASHALRGKGLTPLQEVQLERWVKSPAHSDGLAIPRSAISLTSKERHILEMVSQGKSNKEMAKLLGITPETIKGHMKNIFAKLGVNNRAQAAVVAMSAAHV